jgi:hypothetical protein
MPLLAFDLFPRVTAWRIDADPLGPLRAAQVSGLRALAIYHRGGWAGRLLSQFPASDVERMVDLIQCPIVVAAIEIVMDSATTRQVLRGVASLTTGAEKIHKSVGLSRTLTVRLLPPGLAG